MQKPLTTGRVELLKAQWLLNPIWDIEKTIGYESHAAELKAFMDQNSALQDQLFDQEAEATAEHFGLGQNVEAGGLIIDLLDRIEDLEHKLQALSSSRESQDSSG